MTAKKIFLPESEMPSQWYNVGADIPNGLQPPLDPATGQLENYDYPAAEIAKSMANLPKIK